MNKSNYFHWGVSLNSANNGGEPLNKIEGFLLFSGHLV